MMNGTRSTRKRKVEHPVQDSGFSDENHESSEEEPSDTSESENENEEDEWFEIKKKGSTMKRGKSKKEPVKENNTKEEAPFISEYERIRLQNIAERNELLRSMGINVNYQESASSSSAKKTKEIKKISMGINVNYQESASSSSAKKTKKIKKIKKEKENTPMRMSLRSKNKSGTKGNDSFIDESTKSPDPEPDIDTRNLGSERWLEDEMEGRENFLEDLKKKIFDINYDTDFLNLSSCTKESFRDVMLSLVVEDTPRVVSARIQSLCVHPSTAKRIVFAGSISGSLGIWDVDSPEEESYIELYPNGRPINCMTVDEFNPNQLYLTSHDGTFSLADINTRQFVNIYATPYEEKINHLTWHNQLDANVFLISHGDGSVLVMDKREKSVSKRVKCFQRSARTVQHHPTDKSYFLVSSGANAAGCGIYDLRSKKEVSHLEHLKGLTSAFFSSSGHHVLTTCNDDTIKIWDSQNLSKVKSKVSVSHNNHTGQWLSVFKAQWYPGRDDIFYIGSLMNPRRIQMYTDEGKLLTELRSVEKMSTIQPVLAVHAQLPFVVGGNSTGRLHAFVPPN